MTSYRNKVKIPCYSVKSLSIINTSSIISQDTWYMSSLHSPKPIDILPYVYSRHEAISYSSCCNSYLLP